MQVILKRRIDMSRDDIDELYALDASVYPNGLEGPPGLERVRWADPEWDICIRADTGMLVAHAGILERDALLDGSPVRIGGIAEVLTHPAHRRRGYGAAALRESERIMRDELRTAFALLVCPEKVTPFYGPLGWQRFNGTLLAEVGGGMEPFADSAWLILPVTTDAPATGVLDL